ncbi:MAG: succinate dehydrogenase, cytochrome b556 subunit [Robiginitomaculum sp.]
MSPHLQVWRWHPTMLSSILHRASGIALYFAILKLCLFLALLAAGPKAFGKMAGIIFSPLGAFGFFVVCGVISFHLLNGIRHMLWDSGRGLEPKTANAVSIGIIAAAALLAIALTWLMISAVGGA